MNVYVSSITSIDRAFFADIISSFALQCLRFTLTDITITNLRYFKNHSSKIRKEIIIHVPSKCIIMRKSKNCTVYQKCISNYNTFITYITFSCLSIMLEPHSFAYNLIHNYFVYIET